MYCAGRKLSMVDFERAGGRNGNKKWRQSVKTLLPGGDVGPSMAMWLMVRTHAITAGHRVTPPTHSGKSCEIFGCNLYHCHAFEAQHGQHLQCAARSVRLYRGVREPLNLFSWYAEAQHRHQARSSSAGRARGPPLPSSSTSISSIRSRSGKAAVPASWTGSFAISGG